MPERYLGATQTSDLTLREKRCDADMLLAAGYAAQRNRRGLTALHAYRLRVVGDRRGRHELVEEMIDWTRTLHLGGHRLRITRPEARQVAEITLAWWIYDSCPACTGRCFRLGPGGQHLSAVPCKACDGTGKRRMPSKVPVARRPLSSWMFGELDRMVAMIHADMARVLSQRMNLDL